MNEWKQSQVLAFILAVLLRDVDEIVAGRFVLSGLLERHRNRGCAEGTARVILGRECTTL